jgi:hypothetical protein
MSRDELVNALKEECDDVPGDAPAHLDEFIKQLEEAGFVSV